MDIEEIRLAKQKLSSDISDAINKFNTNTGLMPSDITIDMLDVSTMDGEGQQIAIGEICIRVNV